MSLQLGNVVSLARYFKAFGINAKVNKSKKSIHIDGGRFDNSSHWYIQVSEVKASLPFGSIYLVQLTSPSEVRSAIKDNRQSEESHQYTLPVYFASDTNYNVAVLKAFQNALQGKEANGYASRILAPLHSSVSSGFRFNDFADCEEVEYFEDEPNDVVAIQQHQV